MEREHDAQRGEQPQRVPVGDRVAQPLVGYVGRGAPDVGQHAADQARHAYDGRADHETPDQPAKVLGARPHGPEQDEDQQVEPGAVELDQRPVRRVRPGRREERHQRVAPERGDRDERDGSQPLERPSRLHDPHEQDLCEQERGERRGRGKVAPGVEPHEHDQGAGQQHQRGEGELPLPRGRHLVPRGRIAPHRCVRLYRNTVGHPRMLIAGPGGRRCLAPPSSGLGPGHGLLRRVGPVGRHRRGVPVGRHRRDSGPLVPAIRVVVSAVAV